MLEVSAFASVPAFARGFVRDLRVRWALEEAGLAYGTRLLGPDDSDQPDYRKVQPFGQVPVIWDGEFALFESAAIVLHVGEGCEALLPEDRTGRSKAVQWAFAAMNSVEPYISGFVSLDLFHADEEWARLRRPAAEAMARRRVSQVAAALGDNAFLDGARFTAGDLLMVTVLRICPDLVGEHPALAAYVARCTGRPAFARALAAQLADYDKSAA